MNNLYKFIKYLLFAFFIATLSIVIVAELAILSDIFQKQDPYIFIQIKKNDKKVFTDDELFNSNKIMLGGYNWEKEICYIKSDSSTQSFMIYLRLLLLYTLFPYFIFQLFKIFKSIVNNQVFNKSNYKSIQKMGLTVFIGLLINFLHGIYMSNLISGFLNPGIEARYYNLLSADSYLVYSIFGISILAIAEVFKQGLLLKEDNDLHI